MSETKVEDPICVTCKGPKSTHFDDDGKSITQHQFTTEQEENPLETKDQRTKREAKKRAAERPGLGPTTLMGLGVNPLAIGRLVEILLERQLISTDEALYVAGMGGKPKAAE
jgi:hypothetical protein